MDEVEREAPTRLQTLRDENRALAAELVALQRFVDTMGVMLDALDTPQDESDVMPLLEHVLDNVIVAVGARDGSLLAPDEVTGELEFVIVRGENRAADLVGRRIPAGSGIAGWVAQHRRATIVNNVPADDRFYREVDAQYDYKTSSLLAAPLIGGNRLLGVIEVLNKRDGKLFSIGNQTLLTLMCRFAGELLCSMVADLDLTQSRRMRAVPSEMKQ